MCLILMVVIKTKWKINRCNCREAINNCLLLDLGVFILDIMIMWQYDNPLLLSFISSYFLNNKVAFSFHLSSLVEVSIFIPVLLLKKCLFSSRFFNWRSVSQFFDQRSIFFHAGSSTEEVFLCTAVLWLKKFLFSSQFFYWRSVSFHAGSSTEEMSSFIPVLLKKYLFSSQFFYWISVSFHPTSSTEEVFVFIPVL